MAETTYLQVQWALRVTVFTGDGQRVEGDIIRVGAYGEVNGRYMRVNCNLAPKNQAPVHCEHSTDYSPFKVVTCDAGLRRPVEGLQAVEFVPEEIYCGHGCGFELPDGDYARLPTARLI